MSATLEGEIAELPRLTRSQLEAKWRSALKQPFPAHIGKPLLVPLLAYKLQEQAYGGLKPTVRRRLHELASMFDRDPGHGTRTVRSGHVKPGTRLIRKWEGETHQVTVCEQDFDYNGKRYKSLSEIARLITGTHWSGPLFFGLRRKRS